MKSILDTGREKGNLYPEGHENDLNRNRDTIGDYFHDHV